MPTRPEFKKPPLSPAGKVKAELTALAFSKFLSELESIVPPGRPLSLVVTKLQEACFFAKLGVALDERNQEPQ